MKREGYWAKVSITLMVIAITSFVMSAAVVPSLMN